MTIDYTELCPYCGTRMECDLCDVGVGFVQCGPYCCENCGASEIGPERDRDASLSLDEDEKRTGYYKARTSPYANRCLGGAVVDHKTAKRLYEMGLLEPKP